MWARAATMVVFPTPPLPATIRTRLWLQKVLISMTPRSVVSAPLVGAPASCGFSRSVSAAVLGVGTASR